MNGPCRIAVSGKGGTGKTTLSALLVDVLVHQGFTPILAVDADPNANFHEALGVTLGETLGAMREEAFTRAIPLGMSRREYVRLRFHQVLVESSGFDLLAMGRPEGTGCYCFANDLLTEAIEGLEKGYRFVIIDTEAGMEHLSRGTVGKPDLILITSDPTARGLRTARRIRDLGCSIGLDPARMRLVVNRVKSEEIETGESGITRLGIIPEDPSVEEADREGTPITGIPESSPARMAIREMLSTLMEFCPERSDARADHPYV